MMQKLLLLGVTDKPGIAAAIYLNLWKDNQFNVDMVVQNIFCR